MKSASYLDLVHIQQGTRSAFRFSHGNTLPLTQRPFGMAAFAPQTNGQNGGWWYHPDDHVCEGIRLTHQASPWIADYGSLLFQPQTIQAGDPPASAPSGFRPSEAILRPDYLSLSLLRHQCTIALTPSERGGKFHLTYHGDGIPCFSIRSIGGDFGFHFETATNRLYGYTTHNHCPSAQNFKMHFVLDFGSISLCEQYISAEYSGEDLTAVHISLPATEADISFAFSYISPQQALLNLQRELGGCSFAEIREETAAIWESYLSRIEAVDPDINKLKTFYSCLYRVFLFPNKCYELDSDDHPLHYCPLDGSIREGVRYTNNGFWDTYRTVYPLFSLIAPKEYTEILKGFVIDYPEVGWLPRWTALGETGCMPSTLIDAVIADAAVKGISDNATLTIALQGMLHHAAVESSNPRFGRNGAASYQTYGYVPCDQFDESVNLTLDAAYGDFCIAQVAHVLNQLDICQFYQTRSHNYCNLFDADTGFMRPKDTAGHFQEPFSPFTWGCGYTEGSAWQTSFAVPHDLEGLAALYGGRAQLIQKLDDLFAQKPLFEVGSYGTEIHEMTEMAAVDFGQCAISNQPSFSYPYLYAALGCPDKTEYWITRICRELFSWDENGFPGDEDNGSMSAWYIFSCLGFYPLCPGKPEYIRGKQQLASVKINGHLLDPNNWGLTISHQQLSLFPT